MRIIVGVTGATGAVLAIRTLERLRELEVETHLCISKWGRRTIEYETDFTAADVEGLATAAYASGDQAAAISSGSFPHDGMVVVPCSVRTLAAVASGLCDNLITRAADVTLKERRPLVLVVREAPLSEIHLENMVRATRAGATIVPPVPAFYNRPASIDELVSHIVSRTLDQLGLDDGHTERWTGGLQHD
ncbi:MAG: UbiX family flavin prenyltransferase [bacterium]